MTARVAAQLLTGLLTLPACAATHRDPAVAPKFQREHPWPSTGKRTGPCPGYVEDHTKPLCAGGADRPSNMQWQTVAEAEKKDRKEREMCRR